MIHCRYRHRVPVTFSLLLGLMWPAIAGASADTALRLTNLDGSQTAYVRVANSAAFSLQTFTLEAWVQRVGSGYGFTTDPSGAAIIAKPQEGTSGSNISSWHLHWTNSGQIHFNLVHTPTASGVYLLSSAVATPLAPHHLAVTFDGAMIRLYIDGALSGSAPWSLGTVYYGADDVLIGADNFSFGYFRRFDGYVDDVRVWDYARSEAQISQTMNCHLTGSEAGLVAYWPFDTSTLIDATGHGHDGSVNGNAASAVFASLASLGDCTVGVGDPVRVDAPDLRVAGNPSSGRVRLVLTLPRAGEARVSLLDVSGRVVRVLSDGWHAAGNHELDWDGMTDRGTAAAPGMYFVSARIEGWGVSKRVVLVR
jgi:hypothetical protein